jgi:hypothetical protein
VAWRSSLAIVLCAWVAGCADDGGSATPDATDAGAADSGADATFPDGGPRLFGDGEPFTIVVLPDTQFYIETYHQYFDAQVKWIAAQREALNIPFVLHVGDIVQTYNYPQEWALATMYLGVLEPLIPYALAAGNHDMQPDRLAPLMNATFPPTRFNQSLKGTFRPGEIQNAYYLFPASGKEWLVVSIEFGPRDEVVAWADRIFKMYADHPAILLTHAYMFQGNQRYDASKVWNPPQYWNPHDYALTGSINDGQQMWDKLVSINDNIIFVFSGHSTKEGGAVGRLSTRRGNGAWVHEMLSNYQGCPSDFMCRHPVTGIPEEGGKGFLRKVRVEPANRRALVETFSPALPPPDNTKTDPANQFELPLE